MMMVNTAVLCGWIFSSGWIFTTGSTELVNCRTDSEVE
jgi:hypothetical protein